CRLGVDMLTIHASGGGKMIAAAADAVAQHAGKKPLLLAVTVLTSFDADELAGIGVARELPAQVTHLAKLAHANGATGIVCSAHEAHHLRQVLPASTALVTPGIRMPGDAHGDQARVMSPKEAMQAGATHLVMGRPITQAENPAAALNLVLNSLT
ncbi:MAG: Orotidine 5-phosphate decarboxylase, partial [Pseudomonadota bacterium]